MPYYELFKVADVGGAGEFYSVWAPEPLRVTYRVGEIAVAKVGYLLCFPILGAAWDFIDNGAAEVILRCESEERGFYLKTLLDLSKFMNPTGMLHAALRFWEDQNACYDKRIPAFPGTVGVKRLRVLEVID